MRDIESFRSYLLEQHISKAGKPYSKKIASDIVSRVKLVQGILGRRFTKSNILNEDSFWKLVAILKEARITQAEIPAYYLYNNYVSAMRRYRDYLERLERKDQLFPPKNNLRA
jgi:hypothetical protein